MSFDRNIAGLIDHTILRPDATRADVSRVCEEALRYEFASVCVNSFWVPQVARELSGSKVKVCTVAGFPLGATSTTAKVAEALGAIREGASEIDMVLNIGALLADERAVAQSDILAVARVSHDNGALVKVIIETALLDDEQKKLACHLSADAGADFVKTSTGFAKAGANVADIALMRAAVGPVVGVKASGGIRTLDDLKRMVAAGATRVGASSSVAIIEATRTDSKNAAAR
jgi:deoxyribose-phosphate aldolase